MIHRAGGQRRGLGWRYAFGSHQEASPTSIYSTKRKYRLRREASLVLSLEEFTYLNVDYTG